MLTYKHKTSSTGVEKKYRAIIKRLEMVFTKLVNVPGGALPQNS
jgi:hypothetical protein